ncbi:MAG: hypothetical protein M1148_00950 [Candidatus Thermoplasmatota archaeon]|nr:hypothetical protein [Candidatus Thermoplasmatota archaeon]
MVETTEIVPEMERTATGENATFVVEQSAMRKIVKFFPYAMGAEEVIVNVSGSGVRFYATDTYKTRIGVFYLNKKDLELLEYDGEQTFAVDPDDFKSVTNDLGSGAMLKFTKAGEKIKVEAGDGHTKEIGTVYSPNEIFIPEFNMPYGMRVQGKALYTAIKNLEDMGAEDIRFKTVKAKSQVVLQLSGKRDDKTEEITVTGEKNTFPEGETALFQTEFLLRTLKLVQDADLLLRFKTNEPMKMGVRLPVKNRQHDYQIKGYYLVSPKIPD